MKKRTLGRGGLTVSAMGLGCMGMSEFYGPVDDRESLETIDLALELGVDFLDTADMYGRGKNEELVGKAVKGRRDRFLIATKFAVLRGEDGSFAGVSGKPEYVRSACDASLRRLGVDVIDLYYQHRVDPEVPIEDTVGAMSGLVEEGKVRFIGLSEAGPETIRRAHAVHPVTALQSEYSLWSRDLEKEIIPLCRELGIGIVPYSPLGRGFLTGKINSPEDVSTEGDSRLQRFPRFRDENFRKNRQMVNRLEEIAEAKGRRPAQLVLAWVLSRGDDMVPIPGTKRRSYLRENLGALDISLSPEEIREIDEAVPSDEVSGTRYNEQGMSMIDN